MIYLLLTLLCAPLLLLRARLGRPAVPQRILLIQTAKIGDMICTLPALDALRQRYPDARLTVLCDPLTAPLLQDHPSVDHVWAAKGSAFKGLKGRIRFWKQLRSERFDCSICLSPNQVFLTVPLWAGIARRLTVLPNGGGSALYRLSGLLHSHAEAHQDERLFAETVAALLASIDVPMALQRHMPVTPDARERVGAGLPGKLERWAGLGISSGNKLKALSQEQLLTLAKGLHARGFRVVLVGGPGDEPLAQWLCEHYPQGEMIDTAGRFALADLPALIERLDIYLGVDSGITYMADALQVPLIDIMGPADAGDQRPLSAKAIVIRSELPCAPCSHAFDAPYHCAIGTRACITGIDLAGVLHQADALIAGLH
jgi:ADP-heptose:LPS heptosyltransferase